MARQVLVSAVVPALRSPSAVLLDRRGPAAHTRRRTSRPRQARTRRPDQAWPRLFPTAFSPGKHNSLRTAWLLLPGRRELGAGTGAARRRIDTEMGFVAVPQEERRASDEDRGGGHADREVPPAISKLPVLRAFPHVHAIVGDVRGRLCGRGRGGVTIGGFETSGAVGGGACGGAGAGDVGDVGDVGDAAGGVVGTSTGCGPGGSSAWATLNHEATTIQTAMRANMRTLSC